MEMGDRVRVHAVGSLENGLKFLDTRKAGAPMEFTIGAHTMLPSFERAVMNMNLHDSERIRIPAVEAYGEYDVNLIERVPKEGFPDWESLPIGQFIEFEGPSGSIRCKVLESESECVVLDHNHELAGQDLLYDIEIVELVGESAIDHEMHSEGCTCGCDRLRESLAS